ncbi:MAG: hypothetical protein QF893_00165 [Alphaproteobacteria bacterium]|jgi:hypothetical protein|nr:hypothetical protein [Alphaproteobacteria bacterium]
MTVAYFLNITAPASLGDALAAWARECLPRALNGAGGARGAEVYLPTAEAAADPLTDDGRGPALLLEVDFDDLAGLEAWVASAEAGAFFETCPALARDDCHLDCEAFEVQRFPVAGEAMPSARKAALSFVVRYYRPAADEAAFQAFYVAHHPPILGRFPGIRNVLCYLPLAWRNDSAIATSDCMLGNEVVFDSLADLDAALASEVRHELRRDYERFPPFSGAVTHHAMLRQRLWSAS